ncbi:MAG TPA: phenylalanine--tRNA ligase subunit beta [Burkholderiales bacterium]|nr:phenylalanine--tRNA ligase subunit beta [Burkholderiales bacterium]
MNVPESWLRTLVDPSLTTNELAHLLTMSGLEVESSAPVAPQFSGVTVARVLEVAKHPDADKLSVCRVDAGAGSVAVVCGAPNVRGGLLAPYARPGAQLPGGVTIKIAKVRGVESHGMLCSARELGLSEEHAGLLELPADAVPGSDLRAALALDDRVLTIKLTPNRADCLSILGVAREVAALTRARLQEPDATSVAAAGAARHPVRISEPGGCGRFSARVIRNVNAAAPTPDWMRRRLERAGQRSITALVDVTNYVMLELGRPLHVYDLEKLHGAIDVRYGRKGEKVLLLNGQEVEVDGSVLCITDDSGVIGLAGIMGGESTKAEPTTKNILLESAFFYPEAIAGRARRWGFASDASHRFERGVDYDNNLAGIERATRMILDICGGEPGPTEDHVARLPSRKPVRMRVARAQKVIGVPVSGEEMADVFTRLRLPYEWEGEAFVVAPPSYRFDLEIEEDLIEEVARVHGFERIPAHPPRAAARMSPLPEGRRSLHALRERLAACDYQEVINFSFVEPAWEADFAGEQNPIQLLNPIASQLSVMRTTLIGSLVANLQYNHARKQPRIRVFELGRVFLRDAHAGDGPLAVAGLRQPLRIGAAACGPALEEQWGEPTRRAADFFDVKADLEALLAPRVARFEAATHPAFHPARSARVLIDGAPAGWLGELHPRWQRKYELPQPAVLFEVDAEALAQIPVPRAQVPSRYPPVVRDIAMLFEASIAAQQILATIEADRPPIVQQVTIFDLYQGKNLPPGRKSLAFRVVMQHTERTLTDVEADSARDALVGLLARKFSATLRS